jgi:hypothetical protein
VKKGEISKAVNTLSRRQNRKYNILHLTVVFLARILRLRGYPIHFDFLTFIDSQQVIATRTRLTASVVSRSRRNALAIVLKLVEAAQK